MATATVGTGTLTERQHPPNVALFDELILEWTSNSAGAVTIQSDEIYNGQIDELITDPGTPAPSANYDITVEDSNSIDVLNGIGANRHTSNTETIKHQQAATGSSSDMLSVVDSKLTFKVTNAGDTKQGKIYLRIKKG